MGTPHENYGGALFDYAGNTIAKLCRDNVPVSQPILDIGAGWGKYRFLLPEYEMDAVEVWRPYVHESKLDAYYADVFVEDASTFIYPHRYGAVIMGDVLEHMNVEDAQTALINACRSANHVYVATPFCMPQDAVDGNPHEEHKQEDLTEPLMAARYPQLKLVGKYSRRREHTKAVYQKVTS